MKKFLIAFDFDETIIQHNTDNVILKCNPEEKLPEELLKSKEEGYWNEHMGKVYDYLCDKGVKQEHMTKVLAETPLTKEMSTLFQFLKKHSDLFECIIVSDANIYFISTILEANGLSAVFQKVYTNPSYFDNRGSLVISPFHSHKCQQCPVNMCKRQILHEHLMQRLKEVQIEKVLYAGDGANDFCPSSVLTATDVVFPRKNYPLDRMISEVKGVKPLVFKAQVVPWENGGDILAFLQEMTRSLSDAPNNQEFTASCSNAKALLG
ncbi:phosphoethanolamine/phosphocholine phosphatase [Callorhinchus milii]|uniref:Phosphoethanolamine/phosphocholine phosphatase 1 n=1 Tax=Callorhinchus milii TaxID=7868 RepID=V9KGA7_CALMI|nr:phosphoethanolamine/phosphocholine phosphatase [Callorhinchus milii]XP_007899692.1 phosphoethanolamine/phosphocholine phosphatase [Callorhinchus milii]XP_007899693.1 phosphoethanolamine/phosphocholine phosphatase [Callorhinchus milii]|eukprot:gi/632966925/ref/XP_007899690.1/ PREDICTED: phosphoethanolamine/phosphocholine phosphatase [Callorhinchus milii]